MQKNSERDRTLNIRRQLSWEIPDIRKKRKPLQESELIKE